MMLEEQYDEIIAFVQKGYLKDAALQDDLIDHYCCFIEEKVSTGMPFQQALKAAYEQISPNGLKEIEIETNYLRNFKMYLMMKKIVFTIGFVAAFAASIGTLMKIMHFPFGNVLLFSGIIGLAYFFLPLLVYMRYKSNKLNILRERLKWIVGALSFIITITGVVFKVLHLQGAGVVFGFGMLTFAFGFLPIFFVSMFKESEERKIKNQNV